MCNRINYQKDDFQTILPFGVGWKIFHMAQSDGYMYHSTGYRDIMFNAVNSPLFPLVYKSDVRDGFKTGEWLSYKKGRTDPREGFCFFIEHNEAIRALALWRSYFKEDYHPKSTRFGLFKIYYRYGLGSNTVLWGETNDSMNIIRQAVAKVIFIP